MIKQSTRIQAYQLRAGGVHARMAILRMIAADSANNANPHTRLQAGDWRGARDYTLKGYEHAYGMLSQGFNDKDPVWYSQHGECFRDERYCDKMININHRGWYGDTENGEKVHRGIVGRLTHGRFIAGYEVADNEERVYFPEVFTDRDDAARMADEHARVSAEREDEYSQRWNEAQRLDELIEDKLSEVEKSFALRNHPKLGAKERYWTRKVISDIRAFRAEREALKVD